MAGLMRSRASPRGYLFAHLSEDRKIRITGSLRIEFTVNTSIIGLKHKQAIQKMLLKNQLVLNKLLRPKYRYPSILTIIPNNERLQAKCTIETNSGHLSVRFGQKSTNLDSVTAPLREVCLNNTPLGKISLNLRKQRPSILKIR